MCSELGVSTITVEHAYALLCDEGYIESRQRSGFFVIFRKNDGFASSSEVKTVLKRPEKNENAYPGYVTRTLHYIEAHYAEELSVQGLAEYAGISPDYLSRQFRKVTGIAVQEYIRRYRLSRAVAYLQQGCSVGETARKSGFRSITYFSREFKSEMGVNPSHYKK
jgi:AraC-like DNA-binding protein